MGMPKRPMAGMAGICGRSMRAFCWNPWSKGETCMKGSGIKLFIRRFIERICMFIAFIVWFMWLLQTKDE